jgi:hypothetical protein
MRIPRVRPIWTQTVASPLGGLRLARESETVLVWDGRGGLFLFDRAGKLQAQRPAATPIAVAACAEDGSAFVVGGSQKPLICWMAPDLSPRWQRSLPRAATAVAMEPLGRAVAVADAGGTLHLIDAGGRTQWQATTPRPLHHLAFVPEKPILAAASDFGLVLCFGASGECLWRDGLVAHVGSLAVNGEGNCLLLACFSDGLVRYRAEGAPPQRIALETACHFADVSYAGDRLLTADQTQRICLRDDKGTPTDPIPLDAKAVAGALGALGDSAVLGLANGSILRFEEPSRDR